MQLLSKVKETSTSMKLVIKHAILTAWVNGSLTTLLGQKT
jgi:hypothetical protein